MPATVYQRLILKKDDFSRKDLRNIANWVNSVWHKDHEEDPQKVEQMEGDRTFMVFEYPEDMIPIIDGIVEKFYKNKQKKYVKQVKLEENHKLRKEGKLPEPDPDEQKKKPQGKKPFNKGKGNFNKGGFKPRFNKPGGSQQGNFQNKERKFDNNRPFDRNKPFDKDKPFNKDRNFNRDANSSKDRPFDKDRSYNRDFNRDQKPGFDRAASSYGNKPYNKYPNQQAYNPFPKPEDNSSEPSKPKRKRISGIVVVADIKPDDL